jgi:hypothetical protein
MYTHNQASKQAIDPIDQSVACHLWQFAAPNGSERIGDAKLASGSPSYSFVSSLLQHER